METQKYYLAIIILTSMLLLSIRAYMISQERNANEQKGLN